MQYRHCSFPSVSMSDVGILWVILQLFDLIHKGISLVGLNLSLEEGVESQVGTEPSQEDLI